MNDLTEQWKKGKLINGKKYYITFFDSEPFEAIFRRVDKAIVSYWKFEAHGRQYCDENGYDCVKVLAPVPSYDELQNMNKAVNECMAANIKLVEQNAQLKELLKECKQWFDWYHIDTGTGKEYIESWHKKGHEIHKKIDEVLK